jgi:transposase-like protein
MGTKRRVPPEDKARFFAAVAAGSSITEAARIAGVHINTGSNWLAKSKEAKAKLDQAVLQATRTRGNQGGKQHKEYEQSLDEAVNLPPAIPLTRLCEEAQRGLQDFDFFRRHYLGRVPSPWQVEAALTLVKLLEEPEKEFVVLNVPPGAGKSTLFHDVAVWAIVRNRAIRVMIGSISQAMAKQYSRRIRETLERPAPIQPDPELVKERIGG